MSKYFKHLADSNVLRKVSGAKVSIPAGFSDLSASIISTCTSLQSQLQNIIYITHGAELLTARRTLKEFPNPKARMDFLCSFQYSEADPVVLSVFNHARRLFKDIYELRNILSHEVWSSSEDYSGAVIFSSLDEEARLLMATGRIWHVESATAQGTYDAVISYIRSVKVVTNADLVAAKMDADLCSWMLMHICTILGEHDVAKKAQARTLFFQFKGTSHLFGGDPVPGLALEYKSSKGKTIRR